MTGEWEIKEFTILLSVQLTEGELMSQLAEGSYSQMKSIIMCLKDVLHHLVSSVEEIIQLSDIYEDTVYGYQQALIIVVKTIKTL